MLAAGTPPKMSKAMIRRNILLAFVASFALTGTLWTSTALAQMSDSDMVMRIDHLEAQVRDLTGTIEQLQYRNHQLEQQLQQAQQAQQAQPAAPNAAARPGAPAPMTQYSPQPYPPS